jgi:hypothetical protein
MSTLSQFAAGGIKSIQRGTVAMASSPATVTITAVDTSKSILIANSSNGVSYPTGGGEAIALMARSRLNSSTQIVVTSGATIYGNNLFPLVDWQVIEYF